VVYHFASVFTNFLHYVERAVGLADSLRVLGRYAGLYPAALIFREHCGDAAVFSTPFFKYFFRAAGGLEWRYCCFGLGCTSPACPFPVVCLAEAAENAKQAMQLQQQSDSATGPASSSGAEPILADCLRMQGHFEEASTHYRRLLERPGALPAPVAALYRRGLGDCLRALGRAAEAQEHLLKATELEPQSDHGPPLWPSPRCPIYHPRLKKTVTGAYPSPPSQEDHACWRRRCSARTAQEYLRISQRGRTWSKY